MTQQPVSSKFSSRASLKLVAIGVLCILFLIPSAMVLELIHERSYRQNDAIQEVSTKWGSSQTVMGPILTLPYTVYDIQDRQSYVHYAYFLPQTLSISNDMTTEIRSRGIYDVPLYETDTMLTGTFLPPNVRVLGIDPAQVLWDQATLSLGIPDLKGVTKPITFTWNTQVATFEPGAEKVSFLSSGVSAPVTIALAESSLDVLATEYQFSVDMTLRGSQSMYFYPLGKQTKVDVRSDWPYPSFDGAFLPKERSVTETGFHATWQVLDINRNFPQQWTSRDHVSFSYVPSSQQQHQEWYGDEEDFVMREETGGSSITSDSGFGIEFFIPVDVYQKTERSAKYAFAVVSLLFITIFFIELVVKKSVHPLQYILIGLALIIFYTLLLSLSEYIPFGYAYLISTVAIVSMIGLFLRSLIQQTKLTCVGAGVITVLYGFMYVIIQSQDYTLLIGSIGLFIILAILMNVSRMFFLDEPTS